MSPAVARELVARAPSYEFRSTGKLCTVCGGIVGDVPGDDQVHEQWHEALATLLGESSPASPSS